MSVNEFIASIREDKSENTIEAYRRDLNALEKYLAEKSISFAEATDAVLAGYFLSLKQEGKSSSTIKRKLASIRNYYGFLQEQGKVSVNPVLKISAPKQERREIEYLSYPEVERLLEIPEDSLSGRRDRAILEAMYATGMRVSEVVEVKVSDCNLRMGFIAFSGKHGKARIVPLGRPARQALEKYMDGAREEMLKGKEDHGFLFVNYMGEPMTRQGLWKILKMYGEKAGLEDKMTPHILRSSFAVHMVQNGADIKSLQELMGHEDLAATQVYMSVVKTKIKEVYDRTHPRA